MDDVISRQAAINTVHEMRKKCDTDSIDDYEEMLAVALGELCPAQPDLEELDFVQPHPKTSVTLETLTKVLKQQEHIGHWIFIHPLQENDSGAYICSECKTGDWDINPVKDKVCKFCGARMERE